MQGAPVDKVPAAVRINHIGVRWVYQRRQSAPSLRDEFHRLLHPSDRRGCRVVVERITTHNSRKPSELPQGEYLAPRIRQELHHRTTMFPGKRQDQISVEDIRLGQGARGVAYRLAHAVDESQAVGLCGHQLPVDRPGAGATHLDRMVLERMTQEVRSEGRAADVSRTHQQNAECRRTIAISDEP